MLDLLFVMLTLGLQVLSSSLIFCQIRGIRIGGRLLFSYAGLELLRLALLDASFTPFLTVIELFLIGRYILKDRDWRQSYFYAVYTFFFFFTTYNAFYLFSEEFLPNSFFRANLFPIVLLVLVATVVWHRWLLARLGIEVALLSKSDQEMWDKVLLPLNSGLSLAVLLLLVVHHLELLLGPEDQISHYTGHLISAYVAMLACLLILLNQRIFSYRQDLHQREKSQQYARLKLYTEQVEQMYRTVRGFKHDYKNMLISLDETIRTGNIKQVKQLYDDILISAHLSLIEGENIDDLSNIANSALKSLLYWKLGEAQKSGVTVHLEVKDRIADVAMDTLDFVRIISILLDNALEAARQSRSPELSFALVKQGEGHIIYVKNSMKAESDLSLGQIFQEGVSSKGIGRGTGLYTVRQLIDKYQQVSLETSMMAPHFIQVVYIGV